MPAQQDNRPQDLPGLLGPALYDLWDRLCAHIEKDYAMDRLWNSGGKKWTYEYKYRRGGKTLCALYAKNGVLGFMVILGREEREKFDAQRSAFSSEFCRIYDEAQTYHDGKWLLFEPKDDRLFGDFTRLLAIKRRPNKK